MMTTNISITVLYLMIDEGVSKVLSAISTGIPALLYVLKCLIMRITDGNENTHPTSACEIDNKCNNPIDNPTHTPNILMLVINIIR
ncbi:MAG TPA: hypothetical protein GXZ35_07010 [Acholeplasmataceae bacterium]|nr:hypothetical protein [Acholeplasmataceae bacterium]